MSDSVIDLSAERKARSAAGGAIKLNVLPYGISLAVGSDDDYREGLLDLDAATRHIASMQRAVEALWLAQGVAQVPLGLPGVFALVDAADAPRVLALRWHLKRSTKMPGRFYAQHTIRLTPGRTGKKTTVSLHRFILGDDAPPLIDHQNGIGTDCRRKNMRAATPSENSANVTHSKRQKQGGYKGVHWNKAASKWQASICAGEVRGNGKRKQLYLGCFADPVMAAKAYDAAALKHFGEFASLNFPAAECCHMTTCEESNG